MFYYFLIIISAVGWIVGYYQQSFYTTFLYWSGALAFTVLLCVPDWPFYNRHPVNWLPAIPDSVPGEKGERKKSK